MRAKKELKIQSKWHLLETFSRSGLSGFSLKHADVSKIFGSSDSLIQPDRFTNSMQNPMLAVVLTCKAAGGGAKR